MFRKLFLAIAFILSLETAAARAEEPKVYYFGATGCEFCANGLKFLKRFEAQDHNLKLVAFDIIADDNDASVFVALTRAIGLTNPQVPMTVIGHHIIIGYENDATTGAEIVATVEACRHTACPDVVRSILSRGGAEMVSSDAPWVINRSFSSAAWSPR